MKIIKCLSELISEELDDAGKYIDLALKWKDTDQRAANLFSELSDEEMGHMERLHRLATDKITKYRAEKGDPPADMMAVYNYLHEKHVEKAAEIRIKQNMYKV